MTKDFKTIDRLIAEITGKNYSLKSLKRWIEQETDRHLLLLVLDYHFTYHTEKTGRDFKRLGKGFYKHYAEEIALLKEREILLQKVIVVRRKKEGDFLQVIGWMIRENIIEVPSVPELARVLKVKHQLSLSETTIEDKLYEYRSVK